MALIETPRHSPADLAAWNRWHHLDQQLAHTGRGRLERLATTATDIITDFAAAGPCYVSVSWGRDSTVLADIAARAHLPIPLAYATLAAVPGRIPNPDCDTVRNQFLAIHPHVVYHQLPCGLGGLSRNLGIHRYISGIRGDESGIRKKIMHIHGTATANTCRPIGHWTSTDIWAYLTLHQLPIHPAYAMTYGGALPRDHIRVHSFGGHAGAHAGALHWEDHYYGDITAPLHGTTRARPAPRP